MIEPEIAFADISDNAALAEGLPKYTFAALPNERQEDLAFFDGRIEKGLVAMVPRAQEGCNPIVPEGRHVGGGGVAILASRSTRMISARMGKCRPRAWADATGAALTAARRGF